MKSKKLLAIIAPAMLLASCGGNNKTTTTISKINLTGVKTLVMGQLKSSSINSESNDDEEDLISVDENGNATETEVDVTTGTTTTKTTDIKISRLVKLNKEYAVVSCTYNDVTYDLIVNLTDGTCVKFPDSSLLPNSKEALGGHRKHRGYIKKFAYLNNSISQPNEDENIFYYVNYYETLENEKTVTIRRLVKLDLTDINKPSASTLISPEFEEEEVITKYSVQSFAVDCNGHVAYYATDKANLNEASKGVCLYYLDNNNPAITITSSDQTYTKIEPYFYTMGDDTLYCYLSKNEPVSNFKLATISVKLDEGVYSAIATPLANSQEANSLPKKVLNIEYNNSTGETISRSISVTTEVSQEASKQGAVINELFSNVRQGKKSFELNRFGNEISKKEPHWGKGEAGESNQTVSGTTDVQSVNDGFAGNKYAYLVVDVQQGMGKKSRKFRRIKYDKDNSIYTTDIDISGILEEYFKNVNAEVEEVETDGDSDDTTVIVEDEFDGEGEETSTAVVEVDEDTGASEVVKDIEDASEVVDVND